MFALLYHIATFLLRLHVLADVLQLGTFRAFCLDTRRQNCQYWYDASLRQVEDRPGDQEGLDFHALGTTGSVYNRLLRGLRRDTSPVAAAAFRTNLCDRPEHLSRSSSSTSGGISPTFRWSMAYKQWYGFCRSPANDTIH